MTMLDSGTDADRQAAIAAGIDYLRGLATDHHWTGFPTMAGTSDIWVTAFVVSHLSQLKKPPSLTAERHYVASHLNDEGWGYSPQVPNDADSTTWALIALRRSRSLPAAARNVAHEFLLDHEIDCGIATYLPDSGIRAFINAGAASTQGWTSPHPDVTAAALLSGAYERASTEAHDAIRRITGQQSRAGVTPAYWWRVPYYTSALLLRACREHRVRPPDQFVSQLLRFITAKQHSTGGWSLGSSPFDDPFSTALALECLLHLAPYDVTTARHGAAKALVRDQRDSGGWAGEMVLRIPAPSVSDPASVDVWSRGTGGGNSFVPDEQGVFATTLSTYALDLYGQVEAGDYLGLDPDWPRVDPAVEPIDTTVVEVVNPLPEDAEVCGPEAL